MRYIKILFLFLLIHFIYSDECTDYFESIKSKECNDITVSDKTCYLTSEGCKALDTYTTCSGEGVTVYNGNDAYICGQLAASVNTKKCAIKNGKCAEVLKECSEWVNSLTCSDLDAGADNKRCYLNGAICESHYKSCADIISQNECQANVPLKKKEQTDDPDRDSLQTCIWDGSCKQYEDCSDYKGNDDAICRLIKVFADDSIDTTNICKMVGVDTKTCTKEAKSKCDDFTDNCSERSLIVETNACLDLGGQCKELPKVCESYTGGVQQVCELISTSIAENNKKKCELEGNACKTKDIVCSDYDGDQSKCTGFSPSSNLKKCVYIDDKCLEVYKSCEDVNSDTNTSVNKKTACESTLVYTDSTNIDYTKECVFGKADSSATSETCHEKTGIDECEEYDYNSEDFCSHVKYTSSDTKKCAIVNGKCIEQSRGCGDYKDSDRKECESIVLSEDNKKCALVNDKTCTEITKLCSEYNGNKEQICKQYKPYNTDEKVCAIYKDKCIEQYKYCSDYKGNDEEYCKSIIPYESNTGTTEVGDIYKCILDSKVGCMRTNRECSEAKNNAQCTSISAAISQKSENKRKCIYYNGECKEEYQTCNSYEPEENFVDDTCKGIILDDFKKCEVTGSGTSRTCTQKTTSDCSDYKVELVSAQCETITLDIQNKCVYSGNACKKVSKTCSEITSLKKLSESICTSAPTSDSDKKKCVLSEDELHCEEVDKPQSADPGSNGSGDSGSKGSSGSNSSAGSNGSGGSDTNPSQSGNGNEDKNSASKSTISFLLIIMISLLN